MTNNNYSDFSAFLDQMELLETKLKELEVYEDVESIIEKIYETVESLDNSLFDCQINQPG